MPANLEAAAEAGLSHMADTQDDKAKAIIGGGASGPAQGEDCFGG